MTVIKLKSANKDLKLCGKALVGVTNPNFNVGETLILSGGVATIPTIPVTSLSRNYLISAESGVVDNMIELTGLTIGDKVILRAFAGHTITLKHNDAGAIIKVMLLNNVDALLNERHPLELVLTAATTLVQTNQLLGLVEPLIFYGNTIFEKNVGIGIINPSSPLEIARTTTGTSLTFDRAGTKIGKIGVSSVDFRLDGPIGGTIIMNQSADDVNFLVNADTANALFVRGNDGYVGIGTNNPDEKLAVNGNLIVSGNASVEGLLIPFTTSPTFAVNQSNIQEMPVTSALTSIDISGMAAAGNYTILLKNGASGPYTYPALGSSFGTATTNSAALDGSSKVMNMIDIQVTVSIPIVVTHSIKTVTLP